MQSLRQLRDGLADGIRRLIGSERGSALSEYAWLIAIIAILLVASVSFLGSNVGSLFTAAAEAFSTEQSADDDSDDDSDYDSDDEKKKKKKDDEKEKKEKKEKEKKEKEKKEKKEKEKEKK